MGYVSAKKLLSEYPQSALFQSFNEGKMAKEKTDNESPISEVPIEVRQMKFAPKYSLSLEISKIKPFENTTPEQIIVSEYKNGGTDQF